MNYADILKNAPDGATHYDDLGGDYYKCIPDSLWFIYSSGRWAAACVPDDFLTAESTKYIEDLRTQERRAHQALLNDDDTNQVDVKNYVLPKFSNKTLEEHMQSGKPIYTRPDPAIAMPKLTPGNFQNTILDDIPLTKTTEPLVYKGTETPMPKISIGDVCNELLTSELPTDENGDRLSDKPARYTDAKGRDLIDDWADRKTAEEMRAALLFNIEKYSRRYGKKDNPLREAEKIADYAQRLVEFEKSQAM